MKPTKKQRKAVKKYVEAALEVFMLSRECKG